VALVALVLLVEQRTVRVVPVVLVAQPQQAWQR
jgi:hypothetical protein